MGSRASRERSGNDVVLAVALPGIAGVPSPTNCTQPIDSTPFCVKRRSSSGGPLEASILQHNHCCADNDEDDHDEKHHALGIHGRFPSCMFGYSNLNPRRWGARATSAASAAAEY